MIFFLQAQSEYGWAGIVALTNARNGGIAVQHFRSVYGFWHPGMSISSFPESTLLQMRNHKLNEDEVIVLTEPQDVYARLSGPGWNDKRH